MSSLSDLPILTAYRILAKNLPDTTVVMYDRALTVLLAEGSDLPVLGFSHERVIGYNLRDALPRGIAARYDTYFMQALEGHPEVIEETFGDRRSIYQIQFAPALNDDGSIFAGMIICQNVTAQRTAEAKLRESESRNRALIRAMPDALLMLDSVGTVLDIIQNSYAPQIDGTTSMIPGINIRDIALPQTVVRKLFDLIQHALTSGQLATAEVELTGSPTAPNYAELRCVPLTGTQVLMVVRNTTELRRTQHDLQARLDELTALHARVSDLEQLKTDMLRLGAHDLRSPLMVIMNYGRYLIEDLNTMPDSAHLVQYMSEILESAERMKVISYDILDAERIEQLLSAATLEVIEFVSIFQDAGDGLRASAVLKGHTLTMGVPDHPLYGRGDAPMLREAAGNLISNAIKYTPEGGRIDVTLRDTGDFVEFTVSDNGYGIPKDTLDKLFQPMARVGTKEARREAGTGLGLYLVKRIIERHGGEVFFHSTQGKGSTFGFRLPLNQG